MGLNESYYQDMTHISLFAGIGGIDLATEWAGFRTVLMVEIDKYCQKVLKRHWPDVPIIGDIKDVTKEKVMAYTEQQRLLQCPGGRNREQARYWQGLSEGGSQTLAYTPCKGLEGKVSEPQLPEPEQSTRCDRGDNRRTDTVSPITLITGGFPCQPVSVAGKQRGKEDDRWLWPEMFRVISEIRPPWVVAENVAGLLRMGFNDCISNLEGEGYETTSFLLPACAVNAPHRRDRVFIVAHTNELRFNSPRFYNTDIQKPIKQSVRQGQVRGNKIRGTGLDNKQDVADTTREGLQGQWPKHELREIGREAKTTRSNWWAVEPDVGRVAHGISSRVDRLKALGNAVVPQQIYPILKAIADMELK